LPLLPVAFRHALPAPAPFVRAGTATRRTWRAACVAPPHAAHCPRRLIYTTLPPAVPLYPPRLYISPPPHYCARACYTTTLATFTCHPFMQCTCLALHTIIFYHLAPLLTPHLLPSIALPPSAALLPSQTPAAHYTTLSFSLVLQTQHTLPFLPSSPRGTGDPPRAYHLPTTTTTCGCQRWALLYTPLTHHHYPLPLSYSIRSTSAPARIAASAHRAPSAQCLVPTRCVLVQHTHLPPVPSHCLPFPTPRPPIPLPHLPYPHRMTEPYLVSDKHSRFCWWCATGGELCCAVDDVRWRIRQFRRVK